MAEAHYLDVIIMGREYRVTCAPEDSEALLAAVALVDERMRELSSKSKAVTPERIAVMAALNIAHESIAGRGAQEGFDIGAARRRILAMEAQLESVLAKAQDGLF